MNIIVLGYLVRGPVGGLAWHHLQYVIGLKKLGHNVCFFEESDDYPSCFDPARNVTDTNPAYGLDFADKAFKRFGLGERWVYHDAHTGRWLGPLAGRWTAVCNAAELLLNISGVNPLRPWFQDIAERVLIDTDPVFTQVRHLSEQSELERAGEHTAFFSFGENIASGRCSIPSDGFPWQPTRQPVVLEAWPVTEAPANGHFTTVMQWDSYRQARYRGKHYGMKSASFSPYMDLPAHTDASLELCLGNPTAPRDQLRRNGWLLSDPMVITRDPWSYQHYIQSSRAEFSIAKQGYVISRSGWFSERSANYLASGRPVVTQETGFSDWLKTGSGILAFNNPGEAADCLADVSRHYRHHAAAARDVAAQYFDHRSVLTNLLEDIFSSV